MRRERERWMRSRVRVGVSEDRILRRRERDDKVLVTWRERWVERRSRRWPDFERAAEESGGRCHPRIVRRRVEESRARPELTFGSGRRDP